MTDNNNYHYQHYSRSSSSSPQQATTTPPTFGTIMGNGRRVRNITPQHQIQPQSQQQQQHHQQQHQQHNDGSRTYSSTSRTRTRLHPSGCSSFGTCDNYNSSLHNNANNTNVAGMPISRHTSDYSHNYHNGTSTSSSAAHTSSSGNTDQFVDDLLYQVRNGSARGSSHDEDTGGFSSQSFTSQNHPPTYMSNINSTNTSTTSSTSERIRDGTQRAKLFVWSIMSSSASLVVPSFLKRNKNSNEGEDQYGTTGTNNNNSDWINNLLTPSSSQSDMNDTNNTDTGTTRRNKQKQQSRVEGMAFIGLVLCVFVFMNISMSRTMEKNYLKKIPGTKISGRAAADIARAEKHFHGESAQTLNNKEGFVESSRHKYIQQLRQTTTTSQGGPQRVVGGVVQIPDNNAAAAAGGGGGSASSSITTTYNDNFKKNIPSENFSSVAANGVHRDSKFGEQTTSIITGALPSAFNYVATLPSQPTSTDIPMFWHVPKSGGSLIKQILGQCLPDLVVGSELGSLSQPPNDGQSIKVVEVAGQKVIDVNLYHPNDIQKASQLHLIADRKADVLISPYLYDISRLFTSRNNGRLFTMLRHPIDRAQSTYWHIIEQQLASNPLKAPMTLVDYAQSSRIENNWMTRFLSNKMAGPLKKEHLSTAKLLLKTKFIVGLLNEKEESLKRFDEYYGWNLFPSGGSGRFSTMILSHKTKQIHSCVKTNLDNDSGEPHNSHTRGRGIETNSKEYHLLVMQNSYDIELYDYAVELFNEQRSLFM